MRLKVDAATAGRIQKDRLHVSRDKAIRAATLFRIRPAADPTFIAGNHVSDGFHAAANGDYGVCWLHHGANRAKIARIGQVLMCDFRHYLAREDRNILGAWT